MNTNRKDAAVLVLVLALPALSWAAAGRPKKGFVGDIETMTTGNASFRKVVYTAHSLQLVLMTLQPGEEIGKETHGAVDQFFRVESGAGEIWIGGARTELKAGSAAIVPAGAEHNLKNTGKEPLTLYTIYAPPQHADGTVQATKADAEKSKERFTGKTTE